MRYALAMARFVLASASPRRRELLAGLGLEPEVTPSDVDETPNSGETPLAYVRRVASAKAAAAAQELPALAADTVVALDGVILGKPTDRADAEALLGRLSGRWHAVHTAVALRVQEDLHNNVVTTRVRFRSLSAAEIAAYVASGESDDKAGAYGIQGLGGALVAEVEGSYTNVVGLPLEQTIALLDAWNLR